MSEAKPVISLAALQSGSKNLSNVVPESKSAKAAAADAELDENAVEALQAIYDKHDGDLDAM